MDNSILMTIRKKLGIEDGGEHFDTDLITTINSAFSTLNQVGVESNKIFSIDGELEEWSDFSDDKQTIGWLKDYLYLKTKLVFDPPSSSTVKESFEKTIDELEWRMYSHYQ